MSDFRKHRKQTSDPTKSGNFFTKRAASVPAGKLCSIALLQYHFMILYHIVRIVSLLDCNVNYINR
jgi:hypothetical protein